jgi:hypothetical protein
MLAKVEAMARRKLAALQEALGRDPEGTREVFADVFGPGHLLFSPVEWPNPGQKPLRLWRIEGSARFNLECDPTGNRKFAQQREAARGFAVSDGEAKGAVSLAQPHEAKW